MATRIRELAPFNLGIDSKLRGCDLVKLKVRDVCHGDHVGARAIVMQQKTQRPAQFETTQPTRDTLQAWIKRAALRSDDYLFPSRIHDSPHLGTRQYARILEGWIGELGLDPPRVRNTLDPQDQSDIDQRIFGRCSFCSVKAGEYGPLRRH